VGAPSRTSSSSLGQGGSCHLEDHLLRPSAYRTLIEALASCSCEACFWTPKTVIPSIKPSESASDIISTSVFPLMCCDVRLAFRMFAPSAVPFRNVEGLHGKTAATPARRRVSWHGPYTTNERSGRSSPHNSRTPSNAPGEGPLHVSATSIVAEEQAAVL
jgi:hypothetical protein